jgi:hypothetical protein
MDRQSLSVDEIEVTVRGFFTTHYSFHTATGEWGELTLNGFRRCGRFVYPDGRTLELCLADAWRQRYELREAGWVRGEARPKSAWRRELTVRFDERDYLLSPRGAFSRDWFLTAADGTPLLAVRPRGFFKRGAFLDILGALDGDLLVFAYYLAEKRWEAEGAAAAAAAS